MSHKKINQLPPIAENGLGIWFPIEDTAFLERAEELRASTRDRKGIEIRMQNTRRQLAIPLIGANALRHACKKYPPACNTPVIDIIDAIHDSAPGISDGFTVSFQGLLAPKDSPPRKHIRTGETHFVLTPTVESARVLETVQTSVRAAVTHVTGASLEPIKHSPDLTVAFAKPPASERDINMLTLYYRAMTQKPLEIDLGPLQFSPDPRT